MSRYRGVRARSRNKRYFWWIKENEALKKENEALKEANAELNKANAELNKHLRYWHGLYYKQEQHAEAVNNRLEGIVEGLNSQVQDTWFNKLKQWWNK